MAVMAIAVMMDTLQISRRMRDAGATEPVAEAMAKTFAESTAVVREDLATKADLEALRLATKTDLETFRLATKTDLEALRVATKADIGALGIETKNEINGLKLELAQLETRIQAGQNRLLVWIGGMLVATIGATVTLIKALG